MYWIYLEKFATFQRKHNNSSTKLDTTDCKKFFGTVICGHHKNPLIKTYSMISEQKLCIKYIRNLGRFLVKKKTVQ